MTDTNPQTLARVSNTRVRGMHTVMSPGEMLKQLPASDEAYATVINARNTIHNILQRRDTRPLIIVGPCSIHDPDAALE